MNAVRPYFDLAAELCFCLAPPADGQLGSTRRHLAAAPVHVYAAAVPALRVYAQPLGRWLMGAPGQWAAGAVGGVAGCWQKPLLRLAALVQAWPRSPLLRGHGGHGGPAAVPCHWCAAQTDWQVHTAVLGASPDGWAALRHAPGPALLLDTEPWHPADAAAPWPPGPWAGGEPHFVPHLWLAHCLPQAGGRTLLIAIQTTPGGQEFQCRIWAETVVGRP